MDQNFVLPLVRTIHLSVYERNGKFYVNTRNISDLLGIKQPYDFTADLKRNLGPENILKGETAKFIYENDKTCERKTYIEIKQLLIYLQGDNSYNNKMEGRKQLIASFSKFIKK